MVVGLLGRKLGMTQLFAPTGEAIPVTVIEAGPCHVLQLKTQDRDGYEAVQVGYLDQSRHRAIRAVRGQVARLDSKRQRRRAAAGVEPLPRADCEPKRYVREFRVPTAGLAVGQIVKVDVFRPVAPTAEDLLKQLAETLQIATDKGDWKKAVQEQAPEACQRILTAPTVVDISGITKGRGFQGVIKRHHYSGQRASHGVKKVHRHPGSTGCNTSPGRVVKGRRMSGQLGHVHVTIRNLDVVQIDVDHNLLLVRGAVPGPNGGLLVIRETNRLPVPKPPAEKAEKSKQAGGRKK